MHELLNFNFLLSGYFIGWRTVFSLLEEARKFARKFAGKGGIALRLAMEAVNQGLDLPLERGLELEASVAGLIWMTEDAREGTRAFLEKRKPVFKDR